MGASGRLLVAADSRAEDIEKEIDQEIEELPSHKATTFCEVKLWNIIREEAMEGVAQEPLLAGFLHSTLLSHGNLYDALCFRLANKLASPTLLPTQLQTIIGDVFLCDKYVRRAIIMDLLAVKERDPACRGYSTPILYFKGFQAIQSYRVAHSLWNQDRKALALALQSLISDVFHVDIHPGARIGMGLLMDHAIGVVIGETAVIGDDCSILHNVTLGGNGKSTGDRHPKVGDGVLLGAHVTILGNIRIGNYAKIGAGSVVLTDIPPHSTAVGVPARVVGKTDACPSLSMNHKIQKCPVLSAFSSSSLSSYSTSGSNSRTPSPKDNNSEQGPWDSYMALQPNENIFIHDFQI
mmetsp:Transcript_32879/g.53358  ORF Transcript_32879/g.53358 Transcript_32879/m.53358 type:complete len:351 (-) Transcript_32879:446-1498(-)